MPRKSNFKEDERHGYAFGSYEGIAGEEYDYGEQDEAARWIYEQLEHHAPDEGDPNYARMIGDFDEFVEGFSNGYVHEYMRRNGST
jgi:hypothetical protein